MRYSQIRHINGDKYFSMHPKVKVSILNLLTICLINQKKKNYRTSPYYYKKVFSILLVKEYPLKISGRSLLVKINVMM